jgi:hypothetical protein
MLERQRKVFEEHFTFLTVTEQAKDRIKEEKLDEINVRLEIYSIKTMTRLSQETFCARNTKCNEIVEFTSTLKKTCGQKL